MLSNKSIFIKVGKLLEQKAESPGVGRVEAEPQIVDVDCLKPSWMSDFIGLILHYTHLCLRDLNQSAKRHLVISFVTLLDVGVFLRPIWPEMALSRTKWYRTKRRSSNLCRPLLPEQYPTTPARSWAYPRCSSFKNFTPNWMTNQPK